MNPSAAPLTSNYERDTVMKAAEELLDLIESWARQP
jgi:hypothetical protein